MATISAELDGTTPFGAAAQVTIDTLCRQMMSNLPGTRTGTDIEALHDMRVASRRLRAALRGFKSCFPQEALIPVENEVKAVTQSLGEVRDQDVFIDYLKEYAKTAPEPIGWLIDREEKARDVARLRQLDELDRLEETGMPEMVAGLSAVAANTEPDGWKSSFAGQAAPLVKPCLTRLAKLARAIDDPSNVAELHLMRIGAKRLRYTMEMFLPCFGRPLADEISELKTLQDELGLIHDCDVWVDRLKQYKEEPGLQPERVTALDHIIGERTARRHETYGQAVIHWEELERSHFADRVVELISDRRAVEKAETKEAKAMEDQNRAAEPKAEAPAETKRRTTRPRVKKPAAPAEEPVVEMKRGPLDETKDAVVQARSRLSASGEMDPKLARQFGKLDLVLEKVAAQNDSPVKMEKRLAELKDIFSSVPEDGKLSGKKTEKLQISMRAIRKKLDDLAPKKGK